MRKRLGERVSALQAAAVPPRAAGQRAAAALPGAPPFVDSTPEHLQPLAQERQTSARANLLFERGPPAPTSRTPPPLRLPAAVAPPAPPLAIWKCQTAIAATQASFVLGSVFLKSSLK